jgi:capsular polysaccharide biosynthesis protein
MSVPTGPAAARFQPTELASLAVALGWGAGLFVLALTVPIYRADSESTAYDGSTVIAHRSLTLVDQNGYGVLRVFAHGGDQSGRRGSRSQGSPPRRTRTTYGRGSADGAGIAPTMRSMRDQPAAPWTAWFGRWLRVSRLVDAVVGEICRRAKVEDALVVLITDSRSRKVARRLVAGLGSAEVVVFVRAAGAAGGPPQTWTTIDELIGALARMPAPSVIVDATRGGQRFRLFGQAFYAVREGGAYLAILPSADLRARLQSARQLPSGDDTSALRRKREMVEAIGDVTTSAGLVAVTKRHRHHLTLRHEAVEDVLEQRFGPQWGEVMARSEPTTLRSAIDLVMHGEPAPRPKPSHIEVPALAVRRYEDVTCHPREIMVRENLMLPDSFRHWNSPRLFHKRVKPATAWFGRLDPSIERSALRHEAGEFFAFDSAFPTHFGHLVTETISRFWGWEIARSRNPSIRPVMTHQSRKNRLPGFKRQVLEALGVPTTQILWVTQDESARVESLVAAMPQLENPWYIHPDIAETWSRLAAGLVAVPRRTPEKVFLSRRPGTQRYCTNTPEVERLMAEQGYEVVFAEDIPYSEQVRMFQGARVIAGFAGSALFNIMFNSHAKIVILASRSYVAANEYLIAAVNGNEVHYFWGSPEIDQPAEGFSVDAYQSHFVFPVDEHRTALIAALR